MTEVIVSHHHFDHTAGLRQAVAEGLTVISRRDNGIIFREMTSRPAPNFPDDLARRSKPLRFIPVDDHLQLKDATMAVDIYHVIANNHMAQALRLVSTDRGYDTRDATLVAYGGAGPLHACELAAALRLRRVLVPRFPGALSALGGLLAEERLDLARTRHMLCLGRKLASLIGDSKIYFPVATRCGNRNTAHVATKIPR